MVEASQRSLDTLLTNLIKPSLFHVFFVVVVVAIIVVVGLLTFFFFDSHLEIHLKRLIKMAEFQ